MGDLRAHFSRSEFECDHCGHYEPISDVLLDALERLRAMKKKPLRIVSGFRCCDRNAAVGGYRYSQHLYGRAADIPGGYATADECKAAGFVGIGVRGGRVVHVDVTPGRRPFVFND